MVNKLFFIANKNTIYIWLVQLWQVQPTHSMLPQVFLPLLKHQLCKLPYGIVDWGIYI